MKKVTWKRTIDPGKYFGTYYPLEGIGRVPYNIKPVKGRKWRVIRLANYTFWRTDIPDFDKLSDAKARVQDTLNDDFKFPIPGVDYEGEGVKE